jgi:hypothetical protein
MTHPSKRLRRLHQAWPFVGRWILGTARSAAVVPDPHRLQAGNADDTTSFENHPMFHGVSLERPPGDNNALFGAGMARVACRSASSSGNRDRDNRSSPGREQAVRAGE